MPFDLLCYRVVAGHATAADANEAIVVEANASGAAAGLEESTRKPTS